MFRLYRRWKRHRQEMKALEEMVAILKEQDRHIAKVMAELTALYYEYQVPARTADPISKN